MTAVTPEELAAAWTRMAAEGTWKPPVGDALHECKFERAGFRAYKLSAPDDSWTLTLSRVDLADRDPRALLTVSAPGHDMAFADLDGHVFTKFLGVYGGSNAHAAVKALATLGGSETDWQRRLDYLCARTIRDVSGRNNGSSAYTTGERPERPTASPYAFRGRVRIGRTVSLFGPGSSGKTTIADGLLVSLCTGREIVPGWIPEGKFHVGVLDWDEGREESGVRLYAICNAYEVGLEGYYYKRMGRALADVSDEVGRWIVENEISIVVVSPVNRAIRQSERDPSGPIHELYEVLREFGTTNILIDHVVGSAVEGGATREYGSVAKRDNARGSYSLYQQSEEPGARVVVIKNTKPDALAPRKAPQAIRIEFDPPWPETNGGIYETIRYTADEVMEAGIAGQAEGVGHLRDRIREALTLEHLSMEELAIRLGSKKPSIERVLYRYRGEWFERLPSGKWEALTLVTND